MFTLEQIHDVHNRLGEADTLFAYLQALQAMGVEKVDSYLTDGHSVYVGEDDYQVVSPPVHEVLTIAEESNRDEFLRHLSSHEQGETDYIEMSKGLAASGIEKWTMDTRSMSMIYYDKVGNEMLVEQIE